VALLQPISSADIDPHQARLSVVICGTFRRDQLGLARIYELLSREFEILSPSSLEFSNPDDEFVRLPGEVSESVNSIELRHLRAMTRADFIWLHSPSGYVGVSASMEIGHATGLGIPIFSSSSPSEEVLRSAVNVVDSPLAVTRQMLQQLGRPGQGLSRIQKYYGEAAKRRGWTSESIAETLVHLQEELAELSAAVMKRQQGIRASEDRDADVEGEMADVQLYLVHLSNILEIELNEAVTEKEIVNANRFDQVERIN
jgi:NTP pyrophosphatase (non-canonical NTP hydrolase)